MRTTMILNERLVQRARELTGIKEKTALVHRGLEVLIARESARELAKLGGRAPEIRPIRRRRATLAQSRLSR